MRLTTITTCNNYNKVYLRIPKIYQSNYNRQKPSYNKFKVNINT